MIYTEKQAKRFLETYSEIIPKLCSVYWQTKDFIDPKDPLGKAIKKYAYHAKDIVKSFNLPSTSLLHFLISTEQGPFLGSCKFCEKDFYAKNRTEYVASWSQKKSLPCGHDKLCGCGTYAIRQHENQCNSCWRFNRAAEDKKIAEMQAKEDEQNREKESHTLPFFQGPYICSWRIQNNKVSQSYYWIKLSEIKMIIDRDDHCSFTTFKDCEYYVYMPRIELVKAINYFLFKPTEFDSLYVTW